VTALPPLEEDLRLGVGAVREAGAEILSRFGAAGEVRFKSRDQPVTEADLAADRLLRLRLLAERPAYGWLSEETADSLDRLDRRRVWVVDPIDGTNSFIAAIPEFVVSVALVEEGIPVLAVVYNPVTDELYEAARGRGARRNGAPIRVAGVEGSEGKPVLLASRWEIEAGVLAGYMEGWRVQAMGSTAYRMVKVADGSGHAFLSPARKNEWDVCGAALVVSEAGGRVSRGDGGALRFNQPDPVVLGIAAWSPRVAPSPLPLRPAPPTPTEGRTDR
jgi:myo-inositol-1(or 4)-monophosphatase